MSDTYTSMIKDLVTNNDVVLFMKGTAETPACGFSYSVVNILKELDTPFKDVNILEDDLLRQAIKDFSDWPTLPQLYIKGDFIGGCDIAKEMHESGELEELLKAA